MNELGLMERFANPEYFDGLTFGEKMAGGGVTLLMGMGFTFIILIIIMFAIKAMGALFAKGEQKSKAKAEPTPAPAAARAAVPAVPSEAPAEVSPDSDPALIAVIMAAIAASEGGQPLDNLRVSRITRIPGTKPVWGAAGVKDALDSRTW